MATTKDTLDNQGIYYSFIYSPPKEKSNQPPRFCVCLFQIQVHGSLTSTYGRIQSSPWILTLAVLVGSVGFTVLVLAFFMLQNRRICSRRKCLWPHLGPGHTHPSLFLKIFIFSFPCQHRKDVWFIWRYGTSDQHHRQSKLPGGEWPHPFDQQRRPQRSSSSFDM